VQIYESALSRKFALAEDIFAAPPSKEFPEYQICGYGYSLTGPSPKAAAIRKKIVELAHLAEGVAKSVKYNSADDTTTGGADLPPMPASLASCQLDADGYSRLVTLTDAILYYETHVLLAKKVK